MITMFTEFYAKQCSLLNCDAEISGEPTFAIYGKLLSNVLRIVRKHMSYGLFIFKTFCKFVDSLSIQMSMVSSLFEHCFLAVPISSSFESLECFLVCQGKKSTFSQLSYTLPYDIFVLEHHHKYIPLCREFKENRLCSKPHQEMQISRWREVNEIMSSIFSDNWASSVLVYFGTSAWITERPICLINHFKHGV